VAARDGLDAVKKRKILPLLGFELRLSKQVASPAELSRPLMKIYVQHISKIFLCSVGYTFLCWPVVAETRKGTLKFVALDGPCFSFIIYNDLHNRM
jgi:hypothetical protein